MSDHVDGPRTMADPSIDLTDIFAFTSPENPENTVVVVNLFPGAGQTAWFSNAAYYSAKLKRVRIDGTGKMQPLVPLVRKFALDSNLIVLSVIPKTGLWLNMAFAYCPMGSL